MPIFSKSLQKWRLLHIECVVNGGLLHIECVVKIEVVNG